MPSPLGEKYVGRYTQMLQNTPNANNGTALGALTHAIQSGLLGYSTQKDKKTEREAYEALTRGASAKPWVNPDTGETVGTAGGREGALYALQSQQGNPVAGRLAKELMMGQMQDQQSDNRWQQRFDAQQGAQDKRYEQVAQQQAEAAALQHQQRLAMQQNQFAQQNAMFDRRAAAEAPVPGQPKPVFSGQSVEGQALNGMVESGALTRDQAMTIGAGKTITGPKGEVIFMTPQGIVAQMPGNSPQSAIPIPTQPQVAPAQPQAIPPQAVQPQTQIPSQEQSQIPQSNIPGIALTGPKTSGMNTSQGLAAGFADRMSRSIDQIVNNKDAGTDYVQNALGSVPLVGNSMVSDEYQVFNQARRDFINAQLRRESGAAIAPSEIENATEQYMPRPGDSPAVLAQKEKALMLALDAMVREAGPSYSPPKQPQEQQAPPSGGFSIRRVD